MIITHLCSVPLLGDSSCFATNPFPATKCLLSPNFAILFDVNVIVRLEGADFVIREFDRETLDQGKLVLDLSARGFGILLGLGELFLLSILFQGDIVKRHAC